MLLAARIHALKEMETVCKLNIDRELISAQWSSLYSDILKEPDYYYAAVQRKQAPNS